MYIYTCTLHVHVHVSSIHFARAVLIQMYMCIHTGSTHTCVSMLAVLIHVYPYGQYSYMCIHTGSTHTCVSILAVLIHVYPYWQYSYMFSCNTINVHCTCFMSCDSVEGAQETGGDGYHYEAS